MYRLAHKANTNSSIICTTFLLTTSLPSSLLPSRCSFLFPRRPSPFSIDHNCMFRNFTDINILLAVISYAYFLFFSHLFAVFSLFNHTTSSSLSPARSLMLLEAQFSPKEKSVLLFFDFNLLRWWLQPVLYMCSEIGFPQITPRPRLKESINH